MGIDVVVERIAEGRNLLENLGLLNDIMSWQTSQEVFAAWQAGALVQGVNTANMGIYRLVNGNVVFDFLGKEGNLFVDGRFREHAYNGILGNEFFFPQGEMKTHVLFAIDTKQSVTINYSELKIKTDDCDRDYGYIEVGKENTSEEKKLFFAVYGTDNPGNGKKVYLLREYVVKKQLQKRKNDFIARACYFDDNQLFYARDWFISNYLSAVRGVRLEKVAEGACAENDPFAEIKIALDAGKAFNYKDNVYVPVSTNAGIEIA